MCHSKKKFFNTKTSSAFILIFIQKQKVDHNVFRKYFKMSDSNSGRRQKLKTFFFTALFDYKFMKKVFSCWQAGYSGFNILWAWRYTPWLILEKYFSGHRNFYIFLFYFETKKGSNLSFFVKYSHLGHFWPKTTKHFILKILSKF